MEVYREGQRILERQRFQFPNNWLHVDNIEGEWSAFNEIIKRKDSSIQTQARSVYLTPTYQFCFVFGVLLAFCHLLLPCKLAYKFPKRMLK